MWRSLRSYSIIPIMTFEIKSYMPFQVTRFFHFHLIYQLLGIFKMHSNREMVPKVSLLLCNYIRNLSISKWQQCKLINPQRAEPLIHACIERSSTCNSNYSSNGSWPYKPFEVTVFFHFLVNVSPTPWDIQNLILYQESLRWQQCKLVLDWRGPQPWPPHWKIHYLLLDWGPTIMVDSNEGFHCLFIHNYSIITWYVSMIWEGLQIEWEGLFYISYIVFL